ncbi:unnamed protein product [Anisakis simplex]|uniref:XK-related protein n=1 Tax=Anisakis simplex TaxID=6269 RepID=A0A0M3JVX1_ANISI|nr:unnamed protein product [Anisakis simplex]
MVLFERLTPKLVYFHDGCSSSKEQFRQRHPNAPLASLRVLNRRVLEIDESDRFPRILIVRKFDIFCFVISALSYVLDIGFDVISAYIHFRAQRFWAFTFISLLIVLPSIALNTISFVWWIDDSRLASSSYRERNDTQTTTTAPICCSSVESSSLSLRLFACFFQVSSKHRPVLWYVDAIKAAVRFRRASNDRQRRYFYHKMAEADRDASLLRFFEAFLESAPQLLIQGVVLAHSLWWLQSSEPIQLWIIMALLNDLRTLPAIGTIRFSIPFLDRTTYPSSFLFITAAYCRTSGEFYRSISLILVPFKRFILKHVDSQPSVVPIKYGLLLICAIVHLFTPFNMAEGPTRWRYTIAYLIEFVENLMMATMLFSTEQFTYPYKRTVVLLALGMFLCGILIMIVYYSRWHPAGRSAVISAADKSKSNSDGKNTVGNPRADFNVNVDDMQAVFSSSSTTDAVVEKTEICAALKCSNSEK